MREQQGWPRRLIVYGLVALLALALTGFLAVVLMSRSRSTALVARAQLHVVDASGAPVAGIRVMSRWDQLLRNNALSLGESQADGSVALLPLADSWGTFGRYDVWLDLPGANTTPTRLTADTRLVAPTTAPLVVRLVDENGELLDPAPAPARAVLRGAGSPAVRLFEAGVARFPRVVCNSGMRVDALTHGFYRSAKPPDCSPTEAGVERVVDVVIPADKPRLVGRIVDAAGRPVTGSFLIDVRLSVGTTAQVLIGPQLVTDRDGRFVFLVDDGARSAQVTVKDPARGEAEASALANGPVLDLGTLAFPAK